MHVFLYNCSCLAGESVHFYEEAHELNKIPVDDSVRRVYMARHIIDKYIVAGNIISLLKSHLKISFILFLHDFLPA